MKKLLRESLPEWIAYHLPLKIVYFVLVRALVKYTYVYSKFDITDVRFMEVSRFYDDIIDWKTLLG